MEFSQETYKLIQTIFGSIGVIIGLFFGLFLLIIQSRKEKGYIFLAIFFILFSVRIGKSLFHGYYSIESSYLVVFLGFLLAIGPLLWLFSKNIKYFRFTWNRPYLLMHFIPFVIVIFFSGIIPVNDDSYSWLFHIGIFIHGTTYSLMALYEGLKYLPKQSNNKQELQNKWLIILSIATIAMFLNYLLIYFSIIPYYPGDTFLFSIIIVLLTIWVIQNPALLKIVNNKYLNSNLSPEEIEMYSSLLAESLAGKKLYLNQELSLTSLSTFVGITPKQLSQVINQSYNMNYSQLIAKYRIEEAKKMLRAKKYKDYKISAIAYECGFNNLSSFNVSFKRLTKTTAIQYRNS